MLFQTTCALLMLLQMFTVEVVFRPHDDAKEQDSAVRHIIHRRFRQFAALHGALRSRYSGVHALPAKRMFATRTPDFLRKRASELDDFIVTVMKAAYAIESVDLGAFLGLGDPIAVAVPRWAAKCRQRAEPVLSLLSRGLGEVIYGTKSLCPVCVVADRRGRGSVWHAAAVCRCDGVSELSCSACKFVLGCSSSFKQFLMQNVLFASKFLLRCPHLLLTLDSWPIL